MVKPFRDERLVPHSREILCWYFSITFSSSVHVDCTERKNWRTHKGESESELLTHTLRPLSRCCVIQREG